MRLLSGVQLCFSQFSLSIRSGRKANVSAGNYHCRFISLSERRGKFANSPLFLSYDSSPLLVGKWTIPSLINLSSCAFSPLTPSSAIVFPLFWVKDCSRQGDSGNEWKLGNYFGLRHLKSIVLMRFMCRSVVETRAVLICSENFKLF